MKKILMILIMTILSLSLINVSAQTLPVSDELAQSTARKIFKEIIKLPYYGVFDHIAYKFDGETVTLYGKVTVARNKKDAQYAVKRISGVQRVVNNIEILPLSPFDRAIRLRVIRTFVNRGGSLYRYLQEPNPAVRIIVDRGHLILEGFVASRGDYNLMNILARGISDVFSVTNNLVVEKAEIR